MSGVPTIAFATLGCKTNQAETVNLLAQLQADLAVVPFDQGADIYVINTCTVTHEADRQSRQLVRRALRHNPDARIVVTGCAVDYASAEFGRLPGVRLAARNAQKDEIAGVVASWYGLTPGPERPPGPGAGGGHTRAWLKVAEGCANACSFCVIPAVRGAERSVPAGELVARARRLAEAGYREIVLTGTNIGSYGRDGASGLTRRAGRGTARGATLAPLIERLLAEVPEVARWRVSSIEPIDFPDDLLAAFAHERVCPHVHLCLQSGSDRILAAMRRRYNMATYRRLVDRLRAARPGLTLTTDVIVGFPGESEADFAATVDCLRDIGFAQVHLFPYSDRAGTHAAGLPDHVGPAAIADRMDRAEAAVRDLHSRWQAGWVGKDADALVERVGDTWATGTTAHYLKVRIPAAAVRANQLRRVRVEAVGDGLADATPVDLAVTRD
ncbi:MAG: tRNA (N(6)-L-threonylcarbamoyladenosine(37)-C(2))-methylthiotransferase MtaB [Candidatus Sericytochromatia bacterium]|nr:tRNA (N(6)-L-threonylcarbamoyladenosine(37)-C(2))-methylthiotransferase MtaB [Candidatus Tanganyikabacteria bacterium]